MKQFVAEDIHMRMLGAVLLLALTSFGAGPVGTISSDASFQLRGVRVPAAGVTNWPVLAGDEIVTQSGTATLRFRDGSTADLFSGTKAQVQTDGDKLTLNVLAGFMEVTPSTGARLQVLSAGQPVAVQPGVPVTISTTAPRISRGASHVSTFSFKLPSLSVRK